MLLLLLITVLSFLASLAGKLLVGHFIAQRLALVGSFVGLERSTNAGIAFGIIFLPVIQAIVTTFALLLVLILAWRMARTAYSQIAFGLILGGALENIADRVLNGVVTDFIQVGSFPIFNVADSCITIGVIMLLVELLWVKRGGAA